MLSQAAQNWLKFNLSLLLKILQGKRKPMKIWLHFVFLWLLSGPALATPPYSGTVFVDPDILITDDPSTFVQAVSTGSGSREMFDRRVNEFVTLNALLFDAYYTDDSKVEVQVNPEFDLTEAMRKAAFYGHAIGQLPLALRVNLETVSIHKGDQAFGGGNNNLLIHTDAAGYHGEWLEETLFHESCHISLDGRAAESFEWYDAQANDPGFISTYARDYPDREDVAESCLMYFALRHREERISIDTLATIRETIPNRVVVLDSFNINPVSGSDRVSFFDNATQELALMAVRVGEVYHKVILNLIDATGLVFELESVSSTELPNISSTGFYENGILTVPLVLALGNRYSISFSLKSENPIQFHVVSAEAVP